MLRIFQKAGLIVLLLSSFAQSAAANEEFSINPGVNGIVVAMDAAAELITTTEFLVKNGEAYDAAKDPAMHRSSPPEDGPQHGFFAVSFVILGIFGLFIYFLKSD